MFGVRTALCRTGRCAVVSCRAPADPCRQRCIPRRVEAKLTPRHTSISLALLSLCAAVGAARADAVTDWNANAGAAALASCIAPYDDPLHESRMYAMLHLAVHDALNAIQPRSRPYAYHGSAPRGASVDAAVAAAARDVLVSQIGRLGDPFPAKCIADGIAQAERDYEKALARIPAGTARTSGIALGKAAAAAVIARRANDRSDTPLINPPPAGTGIGEWRIDPGTPPISFAAGWGQVMPFILKDAAQFRPRPPLPVSCDGTHPRHHADGCLRYADDVEELRRLGGDGVSEPTERTAEQTEIALFWVESSPLAWNRIARTVAAARRLDPWQNARLFGLLNVALADGYVASFATKYHYRFWRPASAIREAANDGNPGTVANAANATWMSLLPAPPIPEYESAHAVEGAAAAQVMKRVFGRHYVSFRACSMSLPAGSRCNDGNPVWRTFRSFDQAAVENGDSRVYVGFHFRDGVEKGLKHGRQIGDWTVDQALEPLPGR